MAHLTPRQRALCALAEKMTLTPREMTAEDWQTLRDAGLTEQGLLEVAHVVAIFNYFPRMADGFGLKPDPRLRESAATGIPLQRVD